MKIYCATKNKETYPEIERKIEEEFHKMYPDMTFCANYVFESSAILNFDVSIISFDIPRFQVIRNNSSDIDWTITLISSGRSICIDNYHSNPCILVTYNSRTNKLNSKDVKDANNKINKARDIIKEAADKLRYYPTYLRRLERIKQQVEQAIPGITLDVSEEINPPKIVPNIKYRLYIDGEIYRDGNGRSIFDLTTYDRDSDNINDVDIKSIIRKVKGYVKKHSTNPVKTQSMGELYGQAPVTIKNIANKYKYWICTEKCGGNEFLGYAKKYILDRTYHNTRCGYYNSQETKADIDKLFEFVTDNNMSVNDLIRFARYA